MTPEEHAAWLAERSKSMGASDIAAADTGRYGGAFKAVASKLGIDIGDPIDPDLARRGHKWEQPIADGVAAHTGLAVYGEQALVRRPEQPLIHVTLDGMLGPAGLTRPTIADMTANLEIKTRGPHAPWAWDYWRAQCQVGMWVTQMPACLLAIATIDDRYDPASGQLIERVNGVRYEWVDADPFEQQRLIELGLELWAHVERRELPEPTGPEELQIVKAANTAAGQTCPDCDGDGKHRGGGRRKHCERCDGDGVANIDNPPSLDDLADLIEQRERILATAKAAEDAAKTIEAKIRHRMGEATEAVTTDGRWRVRCGLPIRKFTSRSETDFLDLYGAQAAELGLLRTVLDRDRAKAEMPDEYDALRIATPDRRLTVADLQPPPEEHTS